MKRGFLQRKNIPEKKKEKQQPVIRKEVSEKHYVDRISSMPKNIIYHIFSFIDMKQTVQTCVLSKKWRKFWVSVPTISINDLFWRDDEGELRENAFRNFVNRVLLPSDGSDLKKFHLSCPSYDSVTYRVHPWVNSAVRRNVEHLHLEEMFMPPVSSFSLSTNLKTLELKLVRLSEEMEGGSWCGPVLENLILENCFHVSVNKILISSPRLKYLMLKCEMCCEHSDIDSCEIKICAPNLKFLGCLGFMYKNYNLENLSSLETAHIDTDSLCREELKEVRGTCLKNILRGLIHAKSLTLSVEGIQGFGGLPNMLKKLPKSFPNLMYLKVREWRTDLYIDGLAKLFQIFSCIETLVMEKAVVNPDMYSENNTFGFQVQFSLAEAMEETYGPTNKGDWDNLLAPNSVFQKLRSVEIHYLKCTENEFDFVEYLLKTASVLENIRITTIKPRSNSKEFKYSEFGRKIQSLPRASSSATLSFVQPK
ncbi:F-box/LRR-repeat protein [Thalictrum thalictroides]|uniref:F-box/LRR-repeat protein n=1 Tax=Thalictrum thalictroides TaxID=46969 RepID=A0A7J6XGK6_THATH|nr:F-box/LRR-repeat protein [Thalictrum thalictroides]